MINKSYIKKLIRPVAIQLRKLKWHLDYFKDTFGKMPDDFREVSELNFQEPLIEISKAKSLQKENEVAYEIHENVERKFDITVIIPVYNSEKYVEQCINQVNGSKYRVELIVIDDGQTDNSLEIIKKLRDKNINSIDRFLVVQQDNSGAQSARNKALDLQSGEYVLFLDSDDYLTANTIDKLLDTAYKNQSDIVQMQYQLLYQNNTLQKPQLNIRDNYSETNELKEMLKYPGYNGMKLYKSSLFVNVRFPEGFWYEDTIIHLVIFPKCRKFQCISHVGYIYRQNENGITLQMKGSRKCLDAVRIMPLVIDIMIKNGIEFNDDIQCELKDTLQKVLIKRIRWMSDKELRCIYSYCKPYLQGMQYHSWRGSDMSC